MQTLIIGAGEIGQSLFNVLKDYYKVSIRDIEDPRYTDEFPVVNICYPYSDNFDAITRGYIERYKPQLTIIHSTVKPGTTRQLGQGVVHSPVNGRHPNLAESLRTFTKVIGSVRLDDAERAEMFLSKARIPICRFSSPEASELAKIMCTTAYGMSIIVEKEIHAACEKWGLPFDEVYTMWTKQYDSGYARMNEGQFIRPVLDHVPGPIGGHCVLPNCELVDNWLTRAVKERNAAYN